MCNNCFQLEIRTVASSPQLKSKQNSLNLCVPKQFQAQFSENEHAQLFSLRFFHFDLKILFFLFDLKILFLEVQLIYGVCQYLLSGRVTQLYTSQTFSFKNFLFQFVPGDWIQFPVLYRSALLLIPCRCSNWHLPTSNCQCIPVSPTPPWQPRV